MATLPTNGRALFDALPREATLASRVVREMETMIADGGLADGSRLPPERDLATQFGVSRTVIREAVAALAARGLLDVQAGSGTVVRKPKIDAVARLISLALTIGGAEQTPAHFKETGRLLAGEAAAAAAERRSEEDLETLGRIVRDADAAPRKSNFVRQFLLAVAQAGGNDISCILLDIVLELGGAPNDPATLRPVLDQIRKGDAKAARRAIRDLYDEPSADQPRPPSKKDRRS